MPFRTTLKKLIRRNATAPSLRERAAELRGSLTGQTRRTVVAGSIAAAVPLPVIAAPAEAPSDLAYACDAAAAHVAWVNDPSHQAEHWPDERLNAELDRVDDVLWRVAEEPAAGLDDLSAKARLLIADTGQHLEDSEHASDRATLTLLREVVALSPTRSLPPAPTPLPIERAEYRARLLAAYEEDRLRRPISGRAEGGDLAGDAAELVGVRLWQTAREVLALPPPTTVEGLGLTALAAMILTEADYTNDDPTITAAVGLTRAVLAFTGTPFPAGFVGFGDEPDHHERDEAIYSGLGALPVWAIEQATAERAARTA